MQPSAAHTQAGRDLRRGQGQLRAVQLLPQLAFRAPQVLVLHVVLGENLLQLVRHLLGLPARTRAGGARGTASTAHVRVCSAACSSAPDLVGDGLAAVRALVEQEGGLAREARRAAAPPLRRRMLHRPPRAVRPAAAAAGAAAPAAVWAVPP